MPFKIVQTIEGGEACLSVVPSKWEVNGTLHWPKKHLVAKLSLEEESVPSDKWEKLNCIKKREFSTRAEAYDELERMEGKSDTEMDEQGSKRLPPKKQRRQCMDKGSVFFAKQDFNQLADMLKLTPSNSMQTASDSAEGMIILNTEEEMIIEPSFEQTEQLNTTVEQSSAPQIIYVEPDASASNMGTNFSTGIIISNQEKILENQDKIMQTLAKILTHAEYSSQAINEGAFDKAPSNTTCLNEGIEPVSTLEQLDVLEASLKDENTMKKYIRSMSFICGVNGKSNGLDCCYKLVDYFVTRQFLLQCSWTGNTRTPGGNVALDGEPSVEDNGKVGLKFYRKFRALLLNLIMLADKDFSEIDCDNFFKRIMKNSKQRVVAKTTTSKHRNRPKHLKYKSKKADTCADATSEAANDVPPSDE